jgi:glutamine amidotransferase-like uncharacterized protein
MKSFLLKFNRSRTPLLGLAILTAAIVLPSALIAQDEPASAASKVFVIPPDINGLKTIVAAPATTRPIRIAIYDGPGSGDSGVDNVEARARQLVGAKVTHLTPAEIGTADLTGRFDVVVFSGGSGSKQGNAIGEAGRNNVREFVRNGGGYFGVCAGAYLACANYDWSLAIIDARTVSNKWRRGKAFLDLKLEPAGREIYGPVAGTFKCRYANGPVIKPMGRDDIPDYTTVATFASETAENDTPVGIQVGSPAQAMGTFGKGRVFISSPHPENTPGLENMVPRALLWAAGGPSD